MSGSSHAGVLAHELAEIIPDLVSGEKDAVNEEGKPLYQSVYYAGLTPYLVKAVQEQQTLITALTDRITALEAI